MTTIETPRLMVPRAWVERQLHITAKQLIEWEKDQVVHLKPVRFNQRVFYRREDVYRLMGFSDDRIDEFMKKDYEEM